MKMTIMIPFINNLRFAMPAMGSLKYHTSEETEWMVIDNGSTEPVEKYITQYVKPKRLRYQRFEENQGLQLTNKWAYENCETELLCLLHNDVYIYEKDWDQRIIKYFEEIDKLGIAGFFGAQGTLTNGGRVQDVEFPGQMSGLSNAVEAEIHGMKMKQNWRSCAIFDSYAMVLNMDMLRAGDGFDMRYRFHHFYDRDISLESLRRGYKNIVVNVPHHHVGGMTDANPTYQTWLKGQIGSSMEDGQVHNENMAKFIKKWEAVTPLYVNDDFSFREGPIMGMIGHEYKGDAIVGYDAPKDE